MQNPIALVRAYLPILHFKMKLAKNAHFQSSKVSIKIPAPRLWRARQSHESQPLMPTLTNCQAAHQALKSPPLFLSVSLLVAFDISSELKIKLSGRQLLGDCVGRPSFTAKKKGQVFLTHVEVAREKRAPRQQFILL